MKSANNFALVLVTAPDLKTARKLAQVSLRSRLVACANLIPKLESHYWWQGKLEKSAEVLVLFKTAKSKLPALEECILVNHPYDTPEFLVVPLAQGTPRYLEWLRDSVKG